jgi:hypothetical protein
MISLAMKCRLFVFRFEGLENPTGDDAKKILELIDKLDEYIPEQSVMLTRIS